MGKPAGDVMTVSEVFDRTHTNGYDLIPDETRTEIQMYMKDGFVLSIT